MWRGSAAGVAVAAVAAVVVACGGTGGSRAGAAAPARASGPAPSAGLTASVAVIRAWAGALARGDIDGASAYFAIPSEFQIAPSEPVAIIHSLAGARSVNLALPCGARLLDARPVDVYVDALFRLQARPGADCGAGVGGTGRVAFVIRAGKIAVWRRLADEPGDAARAAPGFHPPSGPSQPSPGTSLA